MVLFDVFVSMSGLLLTICSHVCVLMIRTCDLHDAMLCCCGGCCLLLAPWCSCLLAYGSMYDLQFGLSV